MLWAFFDTNLVGGPLKFVLDVVLIVVTTVLWSELLRGERTSQEDRDYKISSMIDEMDAVAYWWAVPCTTWVRCIGLGKLCWHNFKHSTSQIN